MNKYIYLDNAAATPIDPEIFDEGVFLKNWANPSSKYTIGQESKNLLEKTRIKAAQILSCDPGELYFAPSATIANNIAISGYMKGFPGCNVILSDLEHPSVLSQSNNLDFNSIVVPSKKNGIADIDEMIAKIDDDTRLISLMYVNNIFGTIQPLKELVSKVRNINQERAKKSIPRIIIHTDAVQSYNYLKIDITDLGVDMMTLSSSKIYAPRGSSILFINNGIDIKKLFYGGGQEKGLVSGTQNTQMNYFMVEALEKSNLTRSPETDRITVLQNMIVDFVENDPRVTIISRESKRICNIIPVGIKGLDQDTILTALYLKNIFVGSTSSCSSGANLLPDYLVTAGLGVEFDSIIRISLGRFNTRDDVLQLINTLKKTLDELL